MRIYVSVKAFHLPYSHWFRKKGVELEIMAVSLLCDNGAYYQGVNSGFPWERYWDHYTTHVTAPELPAPGTWKTLLQIRDEVNQFIDLQAGDQEIEFVGHDCYMDQVALAMFFHGTYLPAIERALCQFVDLSQLQLSLVRILSDAHFAHGFEYGIGFPKDTFTLDERQQIFLSHLEYPLYKKRGEVVGPPGKGMYAECQWIRELETFLLRIASRLVLVDTPPVGQENE